MFSTLQIFGIIFFAFLYMILFIKMVDFYRCHKVNVKFNDKIKSLTINGNIYSYNDIIDIKVEENIAKFSVQDKYIMNDYAHNRLCADRIIFVIKDKINPEVVETYSRRILYKILKHISKFKKLEFNMVSYRPPLITFVEMLTIIVCCIIFFIIYNFYR